MWRLRRKASAPILERANELERASEHELIALARSKSAAVIQEIMRRNNRRLVSQCPQHSRQ